MDAKGRFFQEVHVVNALPAVAALDDLYNGDPVTDVVNLAKYDKVTWIIQRGAGATGTAKIQVESCDDTTPTTATAVPFKYWVAATGDTWGSMQTAAVAADGYTTAAGADSMVVVEINASELHGTNKFARLKATEVVNSPVSGSITCILSGPRYMHEVKQTAIV